MLGKLCISPGVQTVKSGHSYVKSKAPSKFSFAGTPRSNLIPLLPVRGVIHCKEHLLPYEAAPPEVAVAHVLQRGTLSVIYNEKIHVRPRASQSKCMSLTHSLLAMHAPRSRSSLVYACQTLACAPSLLRKWTMYPLHAYVPRGGHSITCVLQGGYLRGLARSTGSFLPCLLVEAMIPIEVIVHSACLVIASKISTLTRAFMIYRSSRRQDRVRKTIS